MIVVVLDDPIKVKSKIPFCKRTLKTLRFKDRLNIGVMIRAGVNPLSRAMDNMCKLMSAMGEDKLEPSDYYELSMADYNQVSKEIGDIMKRAGT